MERLQLQMRVNSFSIIAIIAFVFLSCEKTENSSPIASNLLGDFTYAYFDFYYVKSSPDKCAKKMKYVFNNVSDLIQDRRIEFYVQVFLLCYRLDGEFLQLLRETIVKNSDKDNLKDYIAVFRKDLYYQRDKEQLELFEIFINSITERI